MQLIYCSSQRLLSGHSYRPRDYRQGDSAHLHLYISLLFITHYFHILSFKSLEMRYVIQNWGNIFKYF